MSRWEHDSLDDTEETLPVNPRRRKAARAIGCLFVVLILALLVWFGATHLETVKDRGFLGMGGVTPAARSSARG